MPDVVLFEQVCWFCYHFICILLDLSIEFLVKEIEILLVRENYSCSNLQIFVVRKS